MEIFPSAYIAKPTKAHVHIFGSALYNCVSDDIIGDTVAKFHWCWTLDMDHFMQRIAKGNGIFAVDETLANFRLLNGRRDSINDFSVEDNLCIEFGWRIIGFD